MEVKCPRCRKPALFSPSNPFRPFCSERCQMIDLGAWAEEKYTIPVKGSSHAEASEDSSSDSDSGDALELENPQNDADKDANSDEH